jgi:hypothetical protein
MFMQPIEVTESKIEEHFDLVDTNQDPWEGTAQPKLLVWQLEHLRTLWAQQDFPDQSVTDESKPSPVMIITLDPGIIGRTDINNDISGKSVFDVWQTRSTWLSPQFTVLKTPRESQTTAIEGLRKIINSIIVTTVYSCQAQHSDALDFMHCLIEQFNLTMQMFSI